MQDLLKIENLKVSFRSGNIFTAAVEKASLSVRESETVVLAGESGSGKTVTSLSITRLLPKNAVIESGKIDFLGVDTLRLTEQELIQIRGAKIAYIFQEPVSFLNPVYTIGNQISETIILHQGKNKSEAKEEAIELLGRVKLKDPERVYDDYPHRLSGGMNQRCFIAMALACKPKLLIADEPTTSLDVTVEGQILSLLKELQDELNFSLLFITHNLAIAKRIADRIYVMHKGIIVEEGVTENIFSAPKAPHTKELISAYEAIGRL